MPSLYLKKIVKGTGIIFAGSLFTILLGFPSKILVVRSLSQADYGIYSLALVVLGIFTILPMLGLSEGITRQLAYYKDSKQKIDEIISFSLIIILISGILSSILLYVLSGTISVTVFKNPSLSEPLKIFSLVIPFALITNIIIFIFRGFGKVEVKVYFQDILYKVFFITFVVVVFVKGLSLIGILYSVAASYIITTIVLIFYSSDILRVSINKKVFYTGIELLKFSLPLLLVGMLGMIISGTDTLMLGYFRTPQEVGQYNVARSLAGLIPMFIGSAAYIYLPVASQLYSEKGPKELARTYQIITKWLFSGTFPIFLILLVFPSIVLSTLFGSSYVSASIALQILAIGLMFHVVNGLNGLSLIVIGKTKIITIITFFTMVLNVILNFVLIPQFGIVGASIASFSSFVFTNIFASLVLYQFSRIHPFTKNYLKPIGISLLFLGLIYLITRFIAVKLWMLPIFLAGYLAGYVILLLVTRSFDREDIDMMLAIEKRAGIDLSPIKKVIKRFI